MTNIFIYIYIDFFYFKVEAYPNECLKDEDCEHVRRDGCTPFCDWGEVCDCYGPPHITNDEVVDPNLSHG